MLTETLEEFYLYNQDRQMKSVMVLQLNSYQTLIQPTILLGIDLVSLI